MSRRLGRVIDFSRFFKGTGLGGSRAEAPQTHDLGVEESRRVARLFGEYFLQN
jgi:hypothetical protein